MSSSQLLNINKAMKLKLKGVHSCSRKSQNLPAHCGYKDTNIHDFPTLYLANATFGTILVFPLREKFFFFFFFFWTSGWVNSGIMQFHTQFMHVSKHSEFCAAIRSLNSCCNAGLLPVKSSQTGLLTTLACPPFCL